MKKRICLSYRIFAQYMTPGRLETMDPPGSLTIAHKVHISQCMLHAQISRSLVFGFGSSVVLPSTRIYCSC